MSPGRDGRTIFAPASGVGRAAVAVIRMSGPQALRALGALTGKAAPQPRVATLTALRHPADGQIIDHGLVLAFPAPRSFTGEEMVELQVTGGRAVVASVLAALGTMPDLRPAEPGEFAWRAFENGKLDLAEIEGLADLIDSETEAQRRQATRLAGGALSRACREIRAALLEASALVEAQIDFSDEGDVDHLTFSAARDAITEALARVEAALAGAPAAERLRDGLNVVIAGPPNAGKSTLLNALARRDVAIVSHLPGTTRDAIEVALDLKGWPVMLVDTAGLRETEDPIEREGVARARRRAENADLTLWLAPDDAPAPPGLGRVLQVRTKADLREDEGGSPAGMPVSAKTGAGLPELLERIAAMAHTLMSGAEAAPLVNARHRQAFEDAREPLRRALSLDANALELVAENLRLASRALDRVAGRIDVEDVLDEIFARLCIGK